MNPLFNTSPPNDYFSLLSLNIESPVFNEIKSNQETKIKKYTNKNSSIQTYISNYTLGISLSFEDNILNAIFFYNDNIEKFSKYKGMLPYNLDIEKMKNVNIVEYLGDTPNKGGGKYPIFLSYKYLGIEITFLGCNWNDLENPIVYISLYKKEENNIFCCVCLKKVNKKYIECDNNCGIVFYCSQKCKDQHIKYHLKYCKK